MPRFRLRIRAREIVLPDRGDAVVGRDPACEIPIDDLGASRRHATFHVTPTELSVEDGGSRNGTRVNDKPLSGVRVLGRGDRVEIGSHVFIVLDSERFRARVSAAATQSSPRAITRRAAPAQAPSNNMAALARVQQALSVDDADEAARIMDDLVPELCRAGGNASEREIESAVVLLLELAEHSSFSRFFDRIFQIHAACDRVPGGPAIDAIGAALPRLGGAGGRVIEAYVASTERRGARLTTVELVRLRRLATVARSSDGRPAP